MRIVETIAKSVLVKSKLPATDYVINPYTGCAFACAYCYASFMGRFVDEPIEQWGNYIYVKTNAVEVFARELERMPQVKRTASILFSSVTDAWQGPEKKYRLARGILELLSEAHYPGLVSILTKSPLVVRDVEIIKSLRNAELGVTVTTTDDDIGRLMEAHAPSAGDRLATLQAFNAAGIATYAFIGPLLPHYQYRRDLLDQLFRALRDAGTTSIFAEHLNTSSYILRRMHPLLQEADITVRSAYDDAKTSAHRHAVSELVLELVEKYGFELRLGRVIDHNRDRQSQSSRKACTP